tara:strand:+ start:3209 stop:3742 length:534 start_codon:yes stop_codon:yes gene_type:complete
MARRKFNHQNRITNRQPAKIKAIVPGTIVEFTYIGERIFDKKPLVLVLWNNYKKYKIHGINLNYLTDTLIKQLMREILEKDDNIRLIEESHEGDYDDTLPYRNLLNEPYTRIKLPSFKDNWGGNPLSESEAKVQMERLYNQKLKRIVKKQDIYRTYKEDSMGTISVVQYDMRGLLEK